MCRNRQGVAGERIETSRRRSRSLRFAAGLTTPAYTGLAYVALLAALAIVALSASASLASLGAAMLVMLRSLSYGQALQGAYVSASSSGPAIEEIQRRLTLFEEGRRVDAGKPVGVVGPIVAEHVWFAYTPGQDVLRDVTLGSSRARSSASWGLRVAESPPSCSCYSASVTRTVAGSWPTSATWASSRRRASSEDHLRPPAAHLIAGTIADNIRFLRDGVSEEDVERAARLSHLVNNGSGVIASRRTAVRRSFVCGRRGFSRDRAGGSWRT